MTPSRQAHIIRLVTSVAGDHPVIYDKPRCITELRALAAELEGASDAAAKLAIRVAKIFVNAPPDLRLKLDQLDKHRDLDIDTELGCFSNAATRIAETLRGEAEAAEVAAILNAPDDEILAEFRRRHGDPESHAVEMRSMVERILAKIEADEAAEAS